ncbi:caspase family protein [Thioflexithrix psekupsensis]|uniref:DUF4384 domain-containing protein n=1 Tax=Thioflexithrix psekupsensis TaxID=1570016 RepID=A0A251X3R9_9GAMM|nr:caspase family protein [Thioflexithrix psekupsensis]OUD12101.1 hypothetical protein TPSD3_13315 [Thioflexithrix psekupsensis]
MNKKMYALLLVVTCYLPVSVFGASVHGIVLGNTSDRETARFVEKDFFKVVDFLQNVTKDSGLPLELHKMMSGELTTANLDNKIKELRLSRDDVVFFYYLGAGFSRVNSETPLPQLQLSDKEVSFSEVVEFIKAKNPRLLIAAADAGNLIVSEEVKERSMGAGKRKDIGATIVMDSHLGYRDFLLNAKGTIVVASAMPDQSPLGTDEGSYFTKNFLELLNRQLSSGNFSLVRFIGEVAALEFESDGKKQHPFVDDKTSAIDFTPSSVQSADNDYFSVTIESSTKTLSNGDALQTGDGIRIRLTPSDSCQKRGCYLEIFSENVGTQKIIPLFPRKGIQNENPIYSNLALPSERGFYSVDGDKGEDVIYFFASYSDISQRSTAKTIGEYIVPDHIECTEDSNCIHKISFQHQ